jgi:hypothetical protein
VFDEDYDAQEEELGEEQEEEWWCQAIQINYKF